VTLRQTDRLSEVHEAVVAEMGAAALGDAACVAALFNAIDRVADSTGIPLEEEKAEMTADFRSELGIDQFGRAAETDSAAE